MSEQRVFPPAGMSNESSDCWPSSTVGPKRNGSQPMKRPRPRGMIKQCQSRYRWQLFPEVRRLLATYKPA